MSKKQTGVRTEQMNRGVNNSLVLFSTCFDSQMSESIRSRYVLYVSSLLNLSVCVQLWTYFQILVFFYLCEANFIPIIMFTFTLFTLIGSVVLLIFRSLSETLGRVQI